MSKKANLTQAEKQHIVEKIQSSRVFRSSKTSQKLLNYLTQCSIKGNSPKETTIAIDFFGKGADFNPSEQTTVRFHIYKLREKLKKYYETEGKQDPVMLEIPVGHYAVEFIERNTSEIRGSQASPVLIWLLSAVTVVLIVVVVFLWNRPVILNPIPKSNVFWSSFFSNGHPSSVVIGDFYIFEEYDSELGYYRRVMDYYIRSDSAFQVYQETYPERENRSMILGELPHNSAQILQSLIHVFYSLEQDFAFDHSTDLQLDDIKHQNIIFVGSFMNLRLVNKLIQAIPIAVHPINQPLRRLSTFTQTGDTLETFETESFWNADGFIRDYALLARLPGLNGEDYLVIAGFGYASKVEMVRTLADPQRLEEFEATILDRVETFPRYFAAIYEIAGYQLTGYSVELEHFEEIDPQRYQDTFRKKLLTISD